MNQVIWTLSAAVRSVAVAARGELHPWRSVATGDHGCSMRRDWMWESAVASFATITFPHQCDELVDPALLVPTTDLLSRAAGKQLPQGPRSLDSRTRQCSGRSSSSSHGRRHMDRTSRPAPEYVLVVSLWTVCVACVGGGSWLAVSLGGFDIFGSGCGPWATRRGVGLPRRKRGGGEVWRCKVTVCIEEGVCVMLMCVVAVKML